MTRKTRQELHETLTKFETIPFIDMVCCICYLQMMRSAIESCIVYLYVTLTRAEDCRIRRVKGHNQWLTVVGSNLWAKIGLISFFYV